jgi:hypothetical protein
MASAASKVFSIQEADLSGIKLFFRGYMGYWRDNDKDCDLYNGRWWQGKGALAGNTKPDLDYELREHSQA